MVAQRRPEVMQNFITKRMSSSDSERAVQAEETEIQRELAERGIDPSALIKRVHREVDALAQNVRIAQKMDVGPAIIRRRLFQLGGAAVAGLVGFLVVAVLLWTGVVTSPNGKFLAGVCLLGFIAITINGLVAALYVSWTAIATEATIRKAAESELHTVQQALRELQSKGADGVTIIRHLRRYPAIAKYL